MDKINKMLAERGFDELEFFAKIKKKSALFFGRVSLTAMSNFLTGMTFAFPYCSDGYQLNYFHGFTQWYCDTVVKVRNGYASWENHMLYVSGYRDDILLIGSSVISNDT